MIDIIYEDIIRYINYSNLFFNNLSYYINNEINSVLSDINRRSPILISENSPELFKKYQIFDLPLYENPSHVRKNILSVEEARKIGLSISSRDHFHHLGVIGYLSALDNLWNPLIIYKNTYNNELFVVLDLYDQFGNIIVIPIEMSAITHIYNKELLVNRIKSVYGYNNTNIKLMDYINYKIKSNAFIKIYEKKEQGTGTGTVASSFCNNNIANSIFNVNYKTNSLLLLLMLL